MTQQRKIGSHRTSVATEGSKVEVIYHSTKVVDANEEKIVLNTGGWFTSTTKTRMNQASNEYGLGFSVFQKNREWFVTFKGKTIPFEGNTVELTR